MFALKQKNNYSRGKMHVILMGYTYLHCKMFLLQILWLRINFYQVVLNGSDANCRFSPLSLIDKIRIQTICLSKRESLSILLIINL